MSSTDNCICIFAIISLFATELEEPEIGISGKGLIALFQIFQALLFNLKSKVIEVRLFS